MEEIVKKKDGRGGARKGAGRKKSATKRTLAFSIELELLSAIDREFPNRSHVINEAIREFLKKRGIM